MPNYIVEIDGVKLTLPTYAEAIQAAKDLSAKNSVDALIPEKPIPPTPEEGFSIETAKDALKLLQLLHDNPKGAGHEAVMRIWGITSPKGLGPKTGAVERLIGVYNFPEGTVLNKEKTPNGTIWKPGKNTEMAIYALNEFIRLI